MKPTEMLHALGQSLWLDNITRRLLDEGTLERYIAEYSVTGLTSNPTIFDRAIESGHDYDEDIARARRAGCSEEEVFFELAISDLRRGADLFALAYRVTGGVDGWVSLEVSPLLAYSTQETAAAARDLHRRAERENLYIKIPGTPEGLGAIEESIFAGVPINVTLLFSPEQYLAAADAYLRGIERRIEAGLDPAVSSVASLFVSRWDTAVRDAVPAELRDRLGIAIGMRTYAVYCELRASERYQRLEREGARLQRLLFASTSTKSPDASDTLYVDALGAPDTIDTMPDDTLVALAQHGHPTGPLPADGGNSTEVLAEFERAGVDLDALAERLQRDGAEAFSGSWRSLMGRIGQKVEQVAS